MAIEVYFCPSCGSSSIEPYLGGITGQYRCLSCGYIGVLVLEQDAKPAKGKRKRPPKAPVGGKRRQRG